MREPHPLTRNPRSFTSIFFSVARQSNTRLMSRSDNMFAFGSFLTSPRCVVGESALSVDSRRSRSRGGKRGKHWTTKIQANTDKYPERNLKPRVQFERPEQRKWTTRRGEANLRDPVDCIFSAFSATQRSCFLGWQTGRTVGPKS